MTVYVLSFSERHEGISPDGFEVFATREAALRGIAAANAGRSQKGQLVPWDSKYNRENISGLVAAWSDGQWYVYLTEHEVIE